MYIRDMLPFYVLPMTNNMVGRKIKTNLLGFTCSHVSLMLIILFARTAYGQQDAQYSQYTFNGLYINPAYAGYKQDFYIHSFYRSQWTGLEGAPLSFSLAADGSVNDTKVGLGLIFVADKVGAQAMYTASASYAYRLQIGSNENSRLSLGIGAGLIQSGVDGSKLNPVSSGDASIPVGNSIIILPAGRAGILYTNDHVFAGFAADNLFSNLFSYDRSVKAPVPRPHYYFSCGGIFLISYATRVKPSILLKSDGRGPASLDLNGSVLLGERLWLGGAYRTAVRLYSRIDENNLQKSSALLGLVELLANENLRIGYAFDYSLSPLSNYSYGSHEISIGIFLRSGKVKPISAKCYF